MRFTLATLLALAALLPATAGAQAPVPPGVATGTAQSVGSTTATLTGTVDPNGTPTDYRFEYGTSTAYGTTTPARPAGAGEDAVAVQAAVTGLTPATTYHYRLVAGDARGVDGTFRTVAAPAAPTISRLAAADKTSTSVRLTARVNPQRAATTLYAEWGTSPGFGNRTADQQLPSGRRGVPVSFTLEGLPPYRRIYWRVVAVNALGVKRSGTAAFTTLRALTGATLAVSPSVTTWNGAVSVSGRVQGAGVNGIPIALEEDLFPFDGVFAEVAATTTNRVGAFRFPERPVVVASQFRAVTRNALVVISPHAAARVRSVVGIRAKRRTRKSLRLVGDVNPALPTGRAVLQRRTRSGAWRRVAEAALRVHDEVRSSYRFSVRRLGRAVSYRVKVRALDGGAHAPGYSRSVLVGEKKPKPKRGRKQRRRD